MTAIHDTIETLKSIQTIDLTTTGRRSGKRRTIEIWWFHVDGRFIITGTPGPRDWYANVLSDPAIEISTNGSVYSATAAPILDEHERRVVFSDQLTSWYTTQEELDILIATAPMIEVRLRLD
ncbi:MAG: nitroreductase family deazaflavin-dependent oxidoreductase [Proteobacteria bacterium]|nr:nitroreductase family deazaflavin-dependent oxidoreductase [Pseudomonadota bacterium]